MKVKYSKRRVKKFIIDNLEDKEEYESIMNNPEYHIVRTEFAYDKLSRAIVTIWYEENEEA